MNFNYSFIIPHKNSPDLLQRCVDSIPERDDVQVIVVDDNSDEGKKPALRERKNLQVILLDASQSKGAGRARNVGLKHAEGKWLLFPDSDDYYNKGFLDVLDKYKEEDLDVIYFDAESKGTCSDRINTRLKQYNNAIYSAKSNGKCLDYIKYRLHAPWNKIVSKKFIDEYKIQFEEVPTGNDTMFSYQIGFFSSKIEISKNILYVYTINPNSITHKKENFNKILSKVISRRKNYMFYKYIGHPEWGKQQSVFKFALNYLIHFRITSFIEVIIAYIYNYKTIQSVQTRYIDQIETIKYKDNAKH